MKGVTCESSKTPSGEGACQSRRPTSRSATAGHAGLGEKTAKASIQGICQSQQPVIGECSVSVRR